VAACALIAVAHAWIRCSQRDDSPAPSMALARELEIARRSSAEMALALARAERAGARPTAVVRANGSAAASRPAEAKGPCLVSEGDKLEAKAEVVVVERDGAHAAVGTVRIDAPSGTIATVDLTSARVTADTREIPMHWGFGVAALAAQGARWRQA
jgi:hypothetical protein